MKLLEVNRPIVLPRHIQKWLNVAVQGTYHVTPERIVNVDGDVDMSSRNHISIPVQFGTVTGTFDCSSNKLKSLRGAPSRVGKSFVCDRNLLTSLEHAPAEVGQALGRVLHDGIYDGHDGVYATHNPITSLSGIHRVFKTIKGCLSVYGCDIESHVLGVMLIQNLKHFFIENAHVGDIINCALTDGDDIHTVQEQLYEGGFREYAKL